MNEPIQVPSAGEPEWQGEVDKSAVRIGPEPWEGDIQSGQLLAIINGTQQASWAFVKRLAQEQLKREERGECAARKEAGNE
jgi:hypothetical protein